MAARNELPVRESEFVSLAESADSLRLRAPELSLVFARQAMTSEAGRRDAVAHAAATSALVRLGRHAEAVTPGLTTLELLDQQRDCDLAGRVRIDLASCARVAGAPAVAVAILGPVMRSSVARPALRGAAALQYACCLARLDRRAGLDQLLGEADRLFAADEDLTADQRLVYRAMVSSKVAGQRRRNGNASSAVLAAREGLALLDQLGDPDGDGSQVRARLQVELVCALLDTGSVVQALDTAAELIGRPVRAGAASALGRVLLVVATRVHLPAGRFEVGQAQLVDAIRIAERHGADGVLADALTALASLDENGGRLAEALSGMRAARAAEHRRRQALDAARTTLFDTFGLGERLPAEPSVPERTRVPQQPKQQQTQQATQPPQQPSRQSRQQSKPLSKPQPAVIPAQATAQAPPRPSVAPEPKAPPAREDVLDRRGLRRRLAAVRELPVPKPAEEPKPEPKPEPPADPKQTTDPKPPADPKQTAESEQTAETRSALSILQALGISADGGGGRRRARDEEEKKPSRHSRAAPEATVPDVPEPDQVPVVPDPDEIPETPEPTRVPRRLDKPQQDPSVEPVEIPPERPDNAVYGPQPRPDDGPRSGRRRAGPQPIVEAVPDTRPRVEVGLAELLAEALVAYQSGEAEQRDAAARDGASGRHRSPDWQAVDADGTSG